MAILVTGGAGFIGSHIVDELLTQGFEVKVLDDFSEGKLQNLNRWKNHKKLTVHKGSILDFNLVKRLCDQVTCIFHLAADSRIQTGITDPCRSMEINVMGTQYVAEAARQAGVKRIVYSASSSAYGKNSAHIQLRESMKTDCLNPYSVSKKTGEEIMDVYNRLYGISTVSLRYFNVYGPRHQEEGRYATVIAIFRKQMREGKKLTVVGDGEQRRDFTFVSDVVIANMMAMMNRSVTGVLNIGSSVNMSILNLAAKILGQSEQSIIEENKIEWLPPRLGESEYTLADIDEAKCKLGWEPRVNIDYGLSIIDMYEKKFGLGSSGLILV